MSHHGRFNFIVTKISGTAMGPRIESDEGYKKHFYKVRTGEIFDDRSRRIFTEKDL